MPNPSEIQRGWEEEEIARRNGSLKTYQDSRNSITEYHDKCEHLRYLVDKIKNGRLSKSVKTDVLREARALESELGFDLGNYNSSDFGATIAKSS